MRAATGPVKHALSRSADLREHAAAAGGDRDRFYQGTIVRLHEGTMSGVLRTGGGRHVPFERAHLRVLGTARGFAALREGMHVGFDVGRSSRGLMVTTIRVYGED